MKTSLCALAFCCAAAPAIARAQPCSTLPVTVTIKCQAELMGGGQTRTLDAATPPTRLSMQAVGKQASVLMGDYFLSAGLACASRRGGGDMAYQLEVRLSKKGRPYASPLHLAMLRNLALDERAGKPPLTLDSYYFFEPALELVFVGITIVLSLAIMVAFGRWWQR